MKIMDPGSTNTENLTKKLDVILKNRKEKNCLFIDVIGRIVILLVKKLRRK
jgi:hypothetical protein